MRVFGEPDLIASSSSSSSPLSSLRFRFRSRTHLLPRVRGCPSAVPSHQQRSVGHDEKMPNVFDSRLPPTGWLTSPTDDGTSQHGTQRALAPVCRDTWCPSTSAAAGSFKWNTFVAVQMPWAFSWTTATNLQSARSDIGTLRCFLQPARADKAACFRTAITQQSTIDAASRPDTVLSCLRP